MRRRLARLTKATKFSDEVMHIEEATQCLDDGDQDEVRRHQQECKEKQVEEERFRNAFRTRKAEVRTAAAKGAAGKKAAKSVAWKGPKVMPPLAKMKQSDAKLFMPPSPPKSWLWRAHTKGAWFTKVEDQPAVSRSDAAHGGEMIALRLVLQDAWKTWLTLQGFQKADCPIVGLMDIVDLVAASSSSSSIA